MQKTKLQIETYLCNKMVEVGTNLRIVVTCSDNPLKDVELWKSKGFKDIVIYENNMDKFLDKSDELLEVDGVDFILGDIMEVHVVEGAYHALNFQRDICSLRDLSRFTGDIMVTVTCNPKKRRQAEISFLKLRGEVLEASWEGEEIGEWEIISNKGSYKSVMYKEKRNMLTIIKL